MNLTIDQAIKQKLPHFTVIAYTMAVVNQTTDAVWKLLNEISHQYQTKYTISDVVNIPKIKQSRDGYKALGKDPRHTRLACESLLRRIIKKIGLYQLGDIIDLGNILSLLTMRSVCVVDLDRIVGNITIRLGEKEDQYTAIHRSSLNVEHLPVYQDEVSLFGNPTSDTMRTAITDQTTNILVMIICFNQTEILEDEALLIRLYQTYAKAKNIKKVTIGGIL